MTRRALFRQSDVARAIQTVKSGGETVVGVEFFPDGRFRVLTGERAFAVAVNDDGSWVDLAGETQDHGRA